MPQWISTELDKTFAPYVNIDEYKLARYSYDLRGGKNSLSTPSYLYLLDGGLADNLAIHGLLEAISSPYAARIVVTQGANSAEKSTILQAINNGKIRKIVVIVVNSHATPSDTISQSPELPGIIQMIGSVASTPIDSTSNSVNAQMDALLQDLNGAGVGGPNNPLFAGLKEYGVLVDADQLRINDPAQNKLQHEINRVPTSWTITAENLEHVDQAAVLLLHQHPCFQRLLMDLHIQADFVQADYAKQGCRQASD